MIKKDRVDLYDRSNIIHMLERQKVSLPNLIKNKVGRVGIVVWLGWVGIVGRVDIVGWLGGVGRVGI